LALIAVVSVVSVGLGVNAVPSAAGPPAEFGTQTVLTNIRSPISFAYAPDGRIFQGAQIGIVYVYAGGVRHEFLDLRSPADTPPMESRNLRAVVLDPNFAQNRYVWVLLSHRVNAPGSEIIRIQASASDPNVADPSSVTTIFTGGPDFSQHVGGDLAFDAQGRLLASFGDGNDGTVSGLGQLISQDLDQVHGKVIRIDPATGLGVPGNPYYNAAQPGAVRSKVLARGFRNPFRFHYDSQTGNVYVGDVGWHSWEELDVIPPSWSNPDRDLNFGWPCYEGGNGVAAVQPDFAANPETSAVCNAVYTPAEGGTGVGSAAPVYAYRHSDPGGEFGSAIIAGRFNRSNNYTAQYNGAFFFADFPRDRFETYKPGVGVTPFGTPGGWDNPMDIEVAPNGNIAYLTRYTKELKEIVHLGTNHQPNAAASATPTSGPVPLAVQFSSAGTGDVDGDSLTYLWDFGDGSPPSTAANPSHTYTVAGAYEALLTVSDGQPGGTAVASVQIDAGNTKPTVEFVQPTTLTTYRVGQTIPVEIEASDSEDGTLSGSDVTWEVKLHHLGHVHDGEDLFTGTSGSFTPTDHGDDTHLEFVATATDSIGAETTTSVTVLPQTATFSVTTLPPGVPVSVDGQQQVTPFQRQSIVGGAHQVAMPASTTPGGVDYAFVDMTGGGTTSTSLSHAFVMPAGGYSVSGRYRATPPANNLLPNPSFETSKKGWRKVSSTVAIVPASDAVDGTRVLKMDSASTKAYGTERVPAVASTVAGKAYVGVVHARAWDASTAGTEVTLAVREETPAGVFVAQWSATRLLSTSFGALRVLALPSPGNVLEFRVTSKLPLSGTRSFAVDLASLVEVNAPPPPTGVPPGNLTVNPSLELNRTGWAWMNATLTQVASPDAPDGSNIGNVVQRGNDFYQVSTQLPAGPQPSLGRAAVFLRAGNAEATGKKVTLTVQERATSGEVLRTWTIRTLLTAGFVPIRTDASPLTGNTVDLIVRTEGTLAGVTQVDAISWVAAT
jgi:glucose/arabinose dehydrogenase